MFALIISELDYRCKYTNIFCFRETNEKQKSGINLLFNDI